MNLVLPTSPSCETFLDGCLWVYRSWFDDVAQRFLFSRLLDETEWLTKAHHNDDGSVVHLPRLTANYGPRSYDYSGLVFDPLPYTPLLETLRTHARHATASHAEFNALVLQLYRTGEDRVGWHADDLPALGRNPVIVSLSFGATRRFMVRHKTRFDERVSLDLHGGDILVMRANMQHTYVHKVPRQLSVQEPRINLTFRSILTPPPSP